MKWLIPREKPPWMAVLGSMGMDARCFRPVRIAKHFSISLVKSAFYLSRKTKSCIGQTPGLLRHP